MQLTGLLHGKPLLDLVQFPTPEMLGPGCSDADLSALIEKHGSVFVKPIFRGAVGKKGAAGLVARVSSLREAMAEKERLYFARHVFRNQEVKANGVTYEAAVPADYEIYVSISDSTIHRAPVLTISIDGGINIEEVDSTRIIEIPFDPITGMKAYIVANALDALDAPRPLRSPLIQALPKLWELYNDFGMTTLELNPVRMQMQPNGRYKPVACDFKCGFDRDDDRWTRLRLPNHIFAEDATEFEEEINTLRTYQGQSDVLVLNDKGTILAPTFGGGANSAVSEGLGQDGIISSDFGGNPPYEKMFKIAEITYRHWLEQTNVLLIIGGRANNTDIFVTFRALADALRENFSKYGAKPIYVVVGRGGPNLIQGMGALSETLDALGLPYRFFGFDSAITEVVTYAQIVDQWMKSGGKAQITQNMGLAAVPETIKAGANGQ
ncbi:ATP citrate lyase citrate-binding domain-containing protein [Roseovarius sp. 2305UL8-3]|uniref:ATP citrate lyase citrate-binding domain-containing protein n=1 Tax=Roseovarius conchicola TaxID=3121636 RepID=UPI0035273A51